MTKLICLLAFCMVLLPRPVRGQSNEELQKRLTAMEERIRALEAEVKALRSSQEAAGRLETSTPTAQVPSVATAAGGAGTIGMPSGQLPVYGGAKAASKVLNPDVGVIGNFVGAAGRNQINPLKPLSLQESEVSLQAVVDPYARADFFLAIGEEGIEVEEGYVTFPTLPGRFSVRAGRMRAAFGRVNTFHNHTLPWIDRPLATFNLMGGSLEEADVGIKDSGVCPAPFTIRSPPEPSCSGAAARNFRPRKVHLGFIIRWSISSGGAGFRDFAMTGLNGPGTRRCTTVAPQRS